MAYDTQEHRPVNEPQRYTEREIALLARQAARGEIDADVYFDALRSHAGEALIEDVARYEASHPWWKFALGMKPKLGQHT
ncbi:hypothetical protein [Streptomyces sp. NPDC048623]|uniref:hypothetical protein n=1 Tax=Streptomyces sp. NPDC048623 TaxID=3155761 RepID=UPI0034175598